MEKSGQLDVLRKLYPPVPIQQNEGWAPGSIWTIWGERIPLAQDINQTMSPGFPVLCLDIPNELPRSPKVKGC
jgi:hypothetical protein